MKPVARASSLWLWLLIVVTGLLVCPPLVFLLASSVTIEGGGASALGLDHYAAVIDLSGWRLWEISLAYAAGSSALAITVGVTSAWLVARTNAWFRQTVVIAAFLSLAAPVIIKGIGWILLLGPNKGVLNEWLRAAFGIGGVPIELFTLGGMIAIEAIFWAPVVFLLMLPALSAMDASLEEAAAMAGASLAQVFFRITLRLALPSTLAVLLLTFIRSLEFFEVPLLIGGPANLQTFTTVIYDTIHRGFLPRYGEASAYAVLLIIAVALPLAGYYGVTAQARRYATVTGKAFRPARIDLGVLRLPASLYLLLMPLALVAPLAILLWASFLPVYQPPQLSDLAGLSLANYTDVLSRPATLSGLWNGVIVAALSSTLVASFTFVVAWMVVRRREGARWLLDVLASLPLVFPGIVLGTAVLIEVLQVGVIPIYGTIWIMVLGFLIRFMPYGLRFCYAGIVSVHAHLEESARTCGAGTFTILRRIVLPLAMPAIASIWIYVFLYSIRDLSLPVMLAGPTNRLIALVISRSMERGKVPEVGAVSVLLAVAATCLGFAFMRLTRRHGANTF